MPEIAFESRIESDGFATVDDVLSAGQIHRLVNDIHSAPRHAVLSRRNGGVFGGRDLLSECAAVRAISRSGAVAALVTPVLGAAARPVRAIYFDKNRDANWAVAWHQDRTIAVRHRLDVDGYGLWSTKAGIDHVEPPVALLEAMLTVRLHLDDCGANNGPLLVVPGSHKKGRIDGVEAVDIADANCVEICVARRGSALLMRPLLLHASRKASRTGHRRVLSLDYCATGLAGGLEWHAAA